MEVRELTKKYTYYSIIAITTVSRITYKPMTEERVQAYLTNGSPLTGKKIVTSAQRKVEAYLGIPYGKPPVNELRFSGN